MSDAPGALVPRPHAWRDRLPRFLRHGVTVFLLLLVVEYFVIPQLVSASENISLLSGSNLIFLSAAILLEAVSLVAYAVLTRVLIPHNAPDLWTTTRIDLATTAIAHVLPAGTVGSAGLGYRLLTTYGVSGPDAAFAMAAQGMGSAVVLNVMLWLALVISIPLAGVHSIYVVVALAGMLALLAFFTLVYLFTRGEDAAVRAVRRVTHRIPHLDEERVVASINRIGDSVRSLFRDRDLLKRSIYWAAINWLLDAACLYCFLAAFHSYVDPVELFAAFGIANVIAVLPITPGGLGLVEGSLILLLTSFGPSKAISTLAVIGWRLVNFWLPIPIGAACYTSLRLGRRPGLRARRQALSAMVEEARASGGTAAAAEERAVKIAAGTAAAAAGNGAQELDAPELHGIDELQGGSEEIEDPGPPA